MKVLRNSFQYTAKDLRDVGLGLPNKYTEALGIALLKPDGTPHDNPMSPGQLFEAMYHDQFLMYDDLSVAKTDFTNIFYTNIFLVEKIIKLKETMDSLLNIDNGREKNINNSTAFNKTDSKNTQMSFGNNTTIGQTDTSSGSSDANSKYFSMDQLIMPYQNKAVTGGKSPESVVTVQNEAGGAENVSITPTLASYDRSIGANSGKGTQLSMSASEDTNSNLRSSGSVSYSENKAQEQLSRIRAQLPDLRTQFFEQFREMFCVYITPG